jgi:hypothetical protein
MMTDIDKLENGQRVKLFPLPGNPLHRVPVFATFSDGYFCCEGSNPYDGPDYYWGDILTYCLGFEPC